MAIDPATAGIIINAIASRFIDKDKPLGKTNVTTAIGTGFGGAALMLIQTEDPQAQLAGYILGGLGAIIALYKEHKK